MINTIVGGIGSVIGFAVGGLIAEKIGRKWTIVSGLVLFVVSLLIWMIVGNVVTVPTPEADQYNSFPIYLYIIWFVKGFGISLVHVNSFPMVVELCSSKKIGKFTGYYYASSMLAQTITPCLLGLLMLSSSFGFKGLPLYALIFSAISLVIFFFVKNIKNSKTTIKKGLAALDQED
jgi:MFS family permease